MLRAETTRAMWIGFLSSTIPLTHQNYQLKMIVLYPLQIWIILNHLFFRVLSMKSVYVPLNKLAVVLEPSNIFFQTIFSHASHDHF